MQAIGFGPRFALNRRGVQPARFDFSASTLPAGATLRRASAATMTDATGALVSVGSDVARFDCFAGRLRGLLLEPAATNLLSYAADWTNPYWSRFSVVGDATSLLEATGASAAHVVRTTSGVLSYTAGVGVTASVIASERSGSAKRYLQLSIGAAPAFPGAASANFDLASGSVTATANIAAAGAVALDHGAWLCWLSATPLASVSGQTFFARLISVPTASNSYAGDGVSGLNAANVQIEQGGVASSRIATLDGTATRAADLLTLDWHAKGVADGTIGVRYTFDDGSTQDLATTVAGGTAVVPTLARRWLVRAAKI